MAMVAVVFLMGIFGGFLIDAGTDNKPSGWIQDKTAIYEQHKDEYEGNTAKH